MFARFKDSKTRDNSYVKSLSGCRSSSLVPLLHQCLQYGKRLHLFQIQSSMTACSFTAEWQNKAGRIQDGISVLDVRPRGPISFGALVLLTAVVFFGHVYGTINTAALCSPVPYLTGCEARTPQRSGSATGSSDSPGYQQSEVDIP